MVAALSPEEDAARRRRKVELQAARRARLRASAAGAAVSPTDDLLHDATAMDDDGDAGEPRRHGGAGPSHPAPSTVARGEKKTAVFYFRRALALSSCQPPQMLMAALPPPHCHPFRRRFDGRGHQPRDGAAASWSRTFGLPRLQRLEVTLIVVKTHCFSTRREIFMEPAHPYGCASR